MGLARDNAALPGSASNVIAFDDPFVRHRARVRPLRILVADDQSANLLVMRRLLEKAGHRPQIVDDGNDVLNALEAQQFDVVITDLHMPGVSGIEIMKQTRFMEAGRPRTPFIVLTADATTEAQLESERAGAYAFLTKPLVDRPPAGETCRDRRGRNSAGRYRSPSRRRPSAQAAARFRSTSWTNCGR